MQHLNMGGLHTNRVQYGSGKTFSYLEIFYKYASKINNQLQALYMVLICIDMVLETDNI